MADTFAPPSNADLLAVEDGLIKLFELQKAAGWSTDQTEDAYDVLVEEMYDRELIWKGLPKDSEPDADDEIDSNEKNAATAGSDGPSEAHGGTEDQKPKSKVPQKDGPVVAKDSGPPPKANHPSQDDGLRTKSGTKSGKGGNANRLLQSVDEGDSPGQEDGDPNNTGHTNVVPGGKAKQNKSGGTNEISYANREMGKAAPHSFTPSESVAAICGPCGRPIADHVGKFIGSDDSWEYAAYVIKEYAAELESTGTTDPSLNLLLKRDFSSDERRGFAESGVSLPNGSFPIPDEASLHNAVRLVGHGSDPQAAMQHIIERAKTMGMTHALPPAWNVADAGTEEDATPSPGAHGLAPDSGSGGGGKPKSKPASKPSSTPSSTMKAIAYAFKKGSESGLDEDAILEVVAAATSPDFEHYAVLKSDEKRYTLGPVYMPNQYDAHDEWATPEELQKATWGYVEETGGDRTIYLQHTDKPAGEWKEIMQWPYPVNATMQKSIDGVTKSVTMELPAGTVYIGVVWKDWAWEEVKNERITGFSMGGWAKRVEAEISRAG